MNLDEFLKSNEVKHAKHGGEVFDSKDFNNLDEIIDYSININHLIKIDHYKDVIIDSLKEIGRYPDSNSSDLKKTLVKYFNHKITPENLIITAGSMNLIADFCQCVIKANRKVIVSQPTFTEYNWAIQRAKGEIIDAFRKPESNFQLEKELIINQIDSRTSLIIICNPNNPNGGLDDKDILVDIIKFASKHDVMVLLDEAFIEFAGESNSFVPNISQFDNLLISRSFTKFFGIPGLRIGFGVGDPRIIKTLIDNQVLWPVNNIAQKIAEILLDVQDIIESSVLSTQREREKLKNTLEEISGVQVYPSVTNYLLINIKETSLRSTKLKELLIRDKILIRDCSNYTGLNDQYIRVNVKSEQLNRKLICGLKRYLHYQMHDKGIIKINEILKTKELPGIDMNCDYFPCHKGLKDCSFCYCPFYPCYHDKTGGEEIISQKTRKPVWSCAKCLIPHNPAYVNKIYEGLLKLGERIENIPKYKLIELLNSILNSV